MAKSEKNFKIGIIDDHVQSAVSIAQILQYEGFKTFEAYNGKSAITKSKAEKPDLLLLDIKLGKITGYDVAKELPKQKIMFITGFDVESETIAKFKNVLGVIRKPIGTEIANVVRKKLKIPLPKEI